ncbi:bifunctional epoxide hydrolase 2-like protein [Tanacetum coccineum]
MSSNNLLDTHGPDMECNESATQLEELELAAVWHGAKVMVPLKFIVQDMDLVYHIPGVKDYILGYGFKKDVPFLEEVIVMKDVTHWINKVKPHEISKYIVKVL